MSPSRFVRSVLHTPPKQLVNRLRLKTKRSILVQLAKCFPALTRNEARFVPTLAADLPLPLLPHLDHIEVSTNGNITFDLLNEPRSFCLPIPWHLPELNTGTRLWKLHLHYFDYTENLDDTAFELLITDWMAGNPPYREGYWLDCWNSYALSIRVVAWMGEYAKRWDKLSAAFRKQTVSSIAEQVAFLLNNIENDIGGNHVIKNIKALYWAGSFFSNAFADRCRSTANKLLNTELSAQILKDGFHFERSPAYHCQVFGDLMDCWRLMPHGALRDRLSEALHLMAQVTSDITHPDGLNSLFNDGGLDMTWSPETLLSVYRSLFGVSPEVRSRAWLEASGYYVVRSPDFYLLYDAGKVGADGLPAHAHGDIFAFELTVGKQRVFVDAGVYEYNAGERRSKSRSTVMHNTLTLDDMDQCEFWGSFRMGRRATINVNSVDVTKNTIKIDAEHTGYAHLPGEPIHRRILEILPSNIVRVTDEVRGGSGQRAVARLLLHPEVNITEREPNMVTIATPDSVLRVHSETPIRQVESVWWPNFGQEVLTNALELEYGTVPGRWGFEVQNSSSRDHCAPDIPS